MSIAQRLTKQVVAKETLVVVPLSEWRQIEDLIQEARSSKLHRSVAKARQEYKAGKSIPYRILRQELVLE